MNKGQIGLKPTEIMGLFENMHPLIYKSLFEEDEKLREEAEKEIETKIEDGYNYFMSAIKDYNNTLEFGEEKIDVLAMYKLIVITAKKKCKNINNLEVWVLVNMDKTPKMLSEIFKKTQLKPLMMFANRLETYQTSEILYRIVNELPSFIEQVEKEFMEQKEKEQGKLNVAVMKKMYK